MKLKFIVLLMFLGVLQQANGQAVSVSFAPEINFPTGNASNISGIGFGGSFKAETAVALKYAITANVGYDLFLGKKIIGNKTPNITAIPLKLGVKYYSSPDFYLEGQAGSAIRQDEGAKNSFAWSFGMGTLLKNSGVGKLDFGLRYESWSKMSTSLLNNNTKYSGFGFIGLKLGYLFHL